jgi:hypothetical protein
VGKLQASNLKQFNHGCTQIDTDGTRISRIYRGKRRIEGKREWPRKDAEITKGNRGKKGRNILGRKMGAET